MKFSGLKLLLPISTILIVAALTHGAASAEEKNNAIHTFSMVSIDSYSGHEKETIRGVADVISLDTVWMKIELSGAIGKDNGIIKFSENNFILNPSETKRVNFEINIPENYCSGVYDSYLMAKVSNFAFQPDSLKNGTGVLFSTAVEKDFTFTVISSNACATTTTVANNGGGGSSSSGGGNGNSNTNTSVNTQAAPTGTSESPPATPLITRNIEKVEDITSITSNSCLLLNFDGDSIAGTEIINPQNARLLAIGKKVVEKYGKIIKKFENKTKIKSVFRDMRKRDSLRYIAALYDMGILADLSDKNFKPNKNVNRAEFLKLVILATNEKFSQKNLKAIATFEDVHKRSWYAKYIAYGLNNKLIEGYSDKTFKPKNPVNQVEALKMIFTTFGIKPETGLNYSYQDVPADVWYKDIAYTSIYHCIVKQPKNGKFIPNKIITREEAALLIYRVLKIQDDQSTTGVYTALAGQN